MYYQDQRQFEGQFFPIPGTGAGIGFPGGTGGQWGELNRRLTRLEREVQRLDRRVTRLERQSGFGGGFGGGFNY